MGGFVDLHCHWIAGIDDGATSLDESLAMLRGLRSLGYELVVATPHMRPGMFDNAREDLERAYKATCDALAGAEGLPAVGLASEHFFDDVVFERLISGQGQPYPGGTAVLIELPVDSFPTRLDARFFDLRRKRLRPVLAHPERYRTVWKRPEALDPLLDGGTVLQLDVAALVGKYGRAPQRAAEGLAEDGAYYLASSDAHRPRDLEEVRKGIARLTDIVGKEEAAFLLVEGPRSVLEGRVET